MIAVALAFAGPLDQDRYASGDPGARIDGTWWRAFDDPALPQLVDEGLRANPDARSAEARVAALRAVAWQQASGITPSVSFDVSGRIAPTSSFAAQLGGQSIPIDEDVYYTASAQVNAALIADLWGEQTLRWRASSWDVRAAEGDDDAVEQLVAAMVAEAWFDVAMSEARVDLVEEQVAANEDLLTLTELRYAGGDVTGLDVLQQRQNVASARASLPQVRLAARTAKHRLNVVLGRSPTHELPPVDALPPLPAQPPVGTPADLASHPEVRAALARWEASQRRAQSEVRGVMPTLTLSANAGKQWQYFSEWKDYDVWGAGAAISIPLLNGGRSWAAVAATRAEERAAAASYDAAALAAVQEVEGALATEQEAALALEARSAQLEAAVLAWNESRARYATGLTTYLPVLTALQAKSRAELDHLQAHRDLLSARIALHQALGTEPAP